MVPLHSTLAMVSRDITLSLFWSFFQIVYCEEQVECRRLLLLQHFGERDFDRGSCGNTCDNCRRRAEGLYYEYEDQSESARRVVTVSRALGPASMSLLVEVVRGAKTAAVRRVRADELSVYGCGKALLKNSNEAERLVRRMVVGGLLQERTTRQEVHMAVISTLEVCEAAARRLEAGELKLTVPMLKTRNNAAGALPKKGPTSGSLSNEKNTSSAKPAAPPVTRGPKAPKCNLLPEPEDPIDDDPSGDVERVCCS